MGHHGRPIELNQRDVLRAIFSDEGRKAAEQFAEAATVLLSPEPFPDNGIRRTATLRATWWIAGLITTADWIGSNEGWFPYEPPDPGASSLVAYWRRARERAAHAVRQAGLESPRPAAPRPLGELLGPTRSPTPAQVQANDMKLPHGPTMFVLEDATGSGKTEAAQILIHRLMTAGRASGAFWAMPTQATANAMYERQGISLRALFADGQEQEPSLVLAHGQARLHTHFRDNVIEFPGAIRSSPEADADDVDGGVACAAFLANSSRTAFLADIGSGTVDQAILAVLPSKFNTMRLFGLSEKVLVLDEIHAYDAYMLQELNALLRFHASLGGCAILLSATLSRDLSAGLIREWQTAVGATAVDSSESTASEYPLLTTVAGDGGLLRHALKSSPWSHRRVAVCVTDSAEVVVERLLTASRAGAASVWIRNTVDSCRSAAAMLANAGAEDVILFHSRFAQCDRQDIETEVLARFGRAATPMRAGSILIATQVVEQSLDLDFDVMISDLAPIDLLIQRAGRLWRHPERLRPVGPEPELWVLSPEFTEQPAADWLDELLPKTKWVYQDVGALWRTRKLLMAGSAIVAPGELRELIGAVYDDGSCPEQFRRAADRFEGNRSAALSTAAQYTLDARSGYVGEDLLWASDVRVPTRLNDHQVTARLGRITADGSVVPWAAEGHPDLPPWQQWALSEVRVARRRLPEGSAPPPELLATVAATRQMWGRWEQEIPLIPLSESGGEWLAHADTPNGTVAISYSRRSGMVIA